MMLKTPFTVLAAMALAGCASLNNLTSEVSSFGSWPTDRKPGTYVFERLPSQQARPEQQQVLEDAARRAVEAAGFTPAVDEKTADVGIQLGARVTAAERSPFDDPFWWRGGLYYSNYWRHGRGLWGPSVGLSYGPQNYDREVALLIRDRKSGQMLYEARASNDGGSSAINSLLPAMFEAALKDFPTGGINPRQVTVPITR